MAMVVMDGMCDHGHTHYYQATMLEIVINFLRLFFVVTMVMVVMGGMCVQSIMAIRTTMLINCLRLLSFIVTMAMVVMGGMCVQSITLLLGCYVGNCVL